MFSCTRVVNACVLLEFGGEFVLTDPYFKDRWFMRLRERIGLRVEELPMLTAIIGGHGVFDHWQLNSLNAYSFKDETPVFVATESMKRRAIAAGFGRVRRVEWGECCSLSPRLKLEVAPAQRAMGLQVNSYVLSSGGVRVFVGTEARDLEPLREYRAKNEKVDVAFLPIDGSAVAGHRLVMNEEAALEGCRILGAKVLIPIHYALKPLPILLQTPGSLEALLRAAGQSNEPHIVPLETGVRWSLR